MKNVTKVKALQRCSGGGGLKNVTQVKELQSCSGRRFNASTLQRFNLGRVLALILLVSAFPLPRSAFPQSIPSSPVPVKTNELPLTSTLNLNDDIIVNHIVSGKQKTYRIPFLDFLNRILAQPVPDYVFVSFDGGGSVIVAHDVFRVVPDAMTIVGWSILGDPTGSIVFDILKGTPSSGFVTYSSITASAKPTLSSANYATSNTLTGWTTAVAAGSCLKISVTGSPSSVTAVNLVLKVTRP